MLYNLNDFLMNFDLRVVFLMQVEHDYDDDGEEDDFDDDSGEEEDGQKVTDDEDDGTREHSEWNNDEMEQLEKEYRDLHHQEL